jgi:stearoyl-CoA desaturase (delta-9 desaturase)
LRCNWETKNHNKLLAEVRKLREGNKYYSNVAKKVKSKLMLKPVDSTTKIEPITISPKKQKITIKSNSLKASQRLHALVIVLVPLLGTVVAIAIASQLGISLVEVGLLVSMYALSMIGLL